MTQYHNYQFGIENWNQNSQIIIDQRIAKIKEFTKYQSLTIISNRNQQYFNHSLQHKAMIKSTFNPMSTFERTKSDGQGKTRGFINSIFQRQNTQSQNSILSLQDTGQLNSQLQQKSQEIEKQLILSQIEKFRSMNMQKEFPTLIKQLKKYSTKYLTLENSFNSLTQSASAQQKQQLADIQNLSKCLQQMHNHLLTIEQNELIKHDYEKQLLLGLLESFEVRITQLLDQKHQKKQENTHLLSVKHNLQNQINTEKQLTVKLAITKQKLIQQLNYNNNCELEPIHLLKQNNLKQFQTKTNLFQTRFIQEICQNICPQLIQFSQLQHDSFSQILSHQPVQDSLNIQNKMSQLQRKLNLLAQSNLKASNQISLELMKQQLLTQELHVKEEETKKFQQLLEYVNKQPYCIEITTPLPQYCLYDDITKEVVTINELSQTVLVEKEQNLKLKSKLKQASQKLSLLKDHQQQLASLLQKVKNDHRIRQQRLFQQNQLLKLNLQKKHILYQSKLNPISQEYYPPQTTYLRSTNLPNSLSHSTVKLNTIINPNSSNLYPTIPQKNHTNYYINHNLYEDKSNITVSRLSSPRSKIDPIIENDKNSRHMKIHIAQSTILQDIHNTTQERPSSKFQRFARFLQSPKQNIVINAPINGSSTDPRISQLRTRLMANFEALSKHP